MGQLVLHYVLSGLVWLYGHPEVVQKGLNIVKQLHEAKSEAK